MMALWGELIEWKEMRKFIKLTAINMGHHAAIDDPKMCVFLDIS